MMLLDSYSPSHLTFDWMPVLIALAIVVGLLLVFFVPLCVAHAAKAKGRNAVGWFFLSVFISPLFAMLLLLVMGDTDAKRKQKVQEEERWRNAVRPVPATPPSGDEPQQPDHSRYMPR